MSGSAAKNCLMCGNSFPGGSGFDLCPSCMKASAEKAQARDAAPSGPARRWAPWIMGGVAALCAVIVFLRLPALREAYGKIVPPPATVVDPVAQCEANLWHALSLVEGGAWPSKEDLSCPASRSPYMLKTEGGVKTVLCPSPAAHGLNFLRLRQDAQAVEKALGGQSA